MTDMPKGMAKALRDVIPYIGTGAGPDWFSEMVDRNGAVKAWVTLLSSAADDIEKHQKLNGKLYKTLYPD